MTKTVKALTRSCRLWIRENCPSAEPLETALDAQTFEAIPYRFRLSDEDYVLFVLKWGSDRS